MLAREDVVSAVSLPEKKAESTKADHDPGEGQPVFSVLIARRASRQGRRAPRPARRPARRRRCRSARTRMKVSLPRLTFLSCAIRSIRRSASGRCARNLRDAGRQSGRRQMANDPLGVRRLPMRPRRAENSKASAMPSATPSPCAQAIGEAGGGLERMAEGVAEIEQRPLAGLALVARDDRRLHAAAHRDRMLARRPAGEQVLPVRFEPGEEGGVAEQPVFRDFGIAGSGTRAAAACRAARCRRPPAPAGGRRRSGSCRWRELIAVLPPTEESTWASSVVGTCT